MKNINNQEKNQIPLQLFHQGTNPYAYEFLGVHKTITDGHIHKILEKFPYDTDRHGETKRHHCQEDRR